VLLRQAELAHLQAILLFLLSLANVPYGFLLSILSLFIPLAIIPKILLIPVHLGFLPEAFPTTAIKFLDRFANLPVKHYSINQTFSFHSQYGVP